MNNSKTGIYAGQITNYLELLFRCDWVSQDGLLGHEQACSCRSRIQTIVVEGSYYFIKDYQVRIAQVERAYEVHDLAMHR